MMSDELDLDALKAKAEAATPGPWTADCCSAANMVYDRSDSIGVDATREDAEFIAAANPATVLALIERVKAAEAENRRHEEALENWEEVGAPAWIESRDKQIAEAWRQRDAALAREAKVREVLQPHHDYIMKRAAKFGRREGDCVCEQCKAWAALDADWKETNE